MIDVINSSTYVLPIVIGVVAVLFIVCIVMLIGITSLKRKYRDFTSTSTAVDIENVLIDNQKDITSIKQHLKRVDDNIDHIYNNLKITFEKIEVVKYNAFDGMGGQMSAVIVLMNKSNNGILLNSIHTNEGSHLYTKIVTDGKTEQALSKEEETAIKDAMMK